MADEITMTGSVAYSDSNDVAVDLTPAAFLASVATKAVSLGTQSIATTETTLNLGGLAALGVVMLVNRDPTNYVDVKTAASGIKIARLKPGGGFAIMDWSAGGVTAPVAIADTAACVIEKLLCSL